MFGLGKLQALQVCVYFVRTFLLNWQCLNVSWEPCSPPLPKSLVKWYTLFLTNFAAAFPTTPWSTRFQNIMLQFCCCILFSGILCCLFLVSFLVVITVFWSFRCRTWWFRMLLKRHFLVSWVVNDNTPFISAWVTYPWVFHGRYYYNIQEFQKQDLVV